MRLVLSGGPILAPDASGWIDDGYVVTSGDRIVSVGSGPPPMAERAADRRIDLAGRWLLPGLIDSHFHLISRSRTEVDEDLVATGVLEGVISAVTRLAGGITAVRDCGCRHHGIHQLRRAIDAGLVPGPTAVVAGRNPTTKLAPDHWRNIVADGPAGMAAAVTGEVAAGADFIKLILAHAEDPTDWSAVTRYLDDDELVAAVNTARSLGVRTGVHCEGWEEAQRAVSAGVDVLDHAPLVDSVTVAGMKERRTVYVPTVWAFSADSGLTGSEAQAVIRWQVEHRRSVARAAAAGVVIAAGSDAAGSLPAPDVLVDELHALVSCGLSRLEALGAATLGGASAMGRPGALGVLTPAARADLVVVDGDPSVDLDVLRRPSIVVAGGRLYDPVALRAQWWTPSATSGATAGNTARWAHG